MMKLKQLPLWSRLLIVALVMCIAGYAAYYAMTTLLPPFRVQAVLTVDEANLPANTDLAAKPITDVFKSQIKRVSAGRPDSGATLTDMYLRVHGSDALKCPACQSALPADTDITAKELTCGSCSAAIDLAAPFKAELQSVLYTADGMRITFSAAADDVNVALALVDVFMTESSNGILALAAKNNPDRAQAIPNTMTQAERIPNTGPKAVLAALGVMLVLMMLGYLVMTRADHSVAVRRLMAYTLLTVLSILCLFFFYVLFVNATRSHGEIQSGFSALPGKFFKANWDELMKNAELPVWRGMFNSLFVSACTAALATYFSVLTAYAIHAYRFKLRNFAFKFILLVMMVPTQVSVLGFVEMMNEWKWTNTFLPLIIPAIASPTVFFFMKQYMDSALPLAIIEAARIDGSSEFGTFNRIVLHIMKPAMAVQAIFTFVSSWNNYFTPALLLNKKEMKTLPILIAQLRSADWLKFDMGQVYMMIAVSILPVILVYLCLSKFIIAGVAVGGVKE